MSAADEDAEDRHYEQKKAGLERVLGPMHDMVGHAKVPFEAGGALDLYYFCSPPHPGTAFVSMDLIQLDGSGPIPNRMGTYELVAFTRHAYPQSDVSSKDTTAFELIETRLWSILTGIARYSMRAKLEPAETCEVPRGAGEPKACLIFDEYAPEGKPLKIGRRKHGLLLCIEIHRSEMQYAVQHGKQALLDKLKAAGHYPYSDLDREHVV